MIFGVGAATAAGPDCTGLPHPPCGPDAGRPGTSPRCPGTTWDGAAAVRVAAFRSRLFRFRTFRCRAFRLQVYRRGLPGAGRAVAGLRARALRAQA